MSDVILTAERREKLGSRPARKLRAEGRVPVSISGEGRPNLDVHVDLSLFHAARRAHHNLFELKIGSEEETAIVREVQWDLMGEHVVHIEMRRVVRGQALETEVGLDFRGTSRGGAIQQMATTLQIRAIPSKIPDEIHVDTAVFDEAGRESLTAGEIALPEGVELVTDPGTVVAQAVAASSLEAPAEAEPAEGEEPAEPEATPE